MNYKISFHIYGNMFRPDDDDWVTAETCLPIMWTDILYFITLVMLLLLCFRRY
jgi:hypothetical protein